MALSVLALALTRGYLGWQGSSNPGGEASAPGTGPQPSPESSGYPSAEAQLGQRGRDPAEGGDSADELGESGEDTGGEVQPHALMPALIPDTPSERGPPDFSPEFKEQLLRSARASGLGPAEACVGWGAILPLVLRDDATEQERSTGFFNLARACSEGGADATNDQRVAREATRRFSELDSAGEDSVAGFGDPSEWADEPRSFLLFVDAHASGTEASVDGAFACAEPCALAIPVDGLAHRMEFSQGDARAELSWQPTSLEDAPPRLPPLQ